MINEILNNIAELSQKVMADIKNSTDLNQINDVRVKILGKKGELTAILKQMGRLSAEERPVVGAKANELREAAEKAITERITRLKAQSFEAALINEAMDVTLPGRAHAPGHRHPISQTMADIISNFRRLGFSVQHGPDVEKDYYNFEALNFPPEHPARDMQDTFYIDSDDGNLVLRTHTSPIQIRTMEKTRPPVRIIAPGAVYRSDSDITHSPMFHQIEGLAVDRKITMADLKGLLTEFCRMTFGPNKPLRFRPSFFPFTEPSAEVDIRCVICNGDGCRVCKNTGWLEILGSGMVDPAVFGFVDYDPEEFTGFAFGMGIERIAMLRHGISDIRLFFENDIRFLSQF